MKIDWNTVTVAGIRMEVSLIWNRDGHDSLLRTGRLLSGIGRNLNLLRIRMTITAENWNDLGSLFRTGHREWT